MITPSTHALLKSTEVAREFGVARKTVGRWVAQGRLPAVRTLGGHLRFRRVDVERAIEGASD